MSFIEEQRKTVIEDNNTAQEDFFNLLEHLNPADINIIVREPLSGDLDFEILQKCNFSNAVSICLSPGNITSIRNIPKGITKLECGENLLVDLPEFPESLTELDIHGNYVKRLPELPVNLRELHANDNQLQSLDRLPEKLVVLKCSNNYLKTLSLAGLDELKTLHCSNNPLLVVEHLPETLTDFVMENDVATQVNRVTEPNTPKDPENTIEKRANYKECLYTYFELKNRYMTGVYKLKQDTYRRSKSKKEARVKMRNLKPKCIECNRPVGTVFKTKGRTHIAKCGDESSPCSLDIELFAGEYNTVGDLLDYYKNSIETTKQKIMVDKLEVVLNYILEEDGVTLFKENIGDYTKENVHYDLIKKEHDNLRFNEETYEKIRQKQQKMKEIQERIDDMYKVAAATGDGATAFKDAMAMYIDELLPEVENMQYIKYQTREIEENNGIYRVCQYPWKIHQFEYTFGEYPKVVKFRVKTI
uniref:Leucine-rich repeat domain-containing protein n=1 Tax=viral metagenome TaxID=1070528 RepID=A0A6C0DXF9_9ZZZZ